MNKKIIKLAMIRANDESPCPFGLSIDFACKNVGSAVDKMAPINAFPDLSPQEQQEIIEANNYILRWLSDNSPCKYAGKIIDKKDAVECNYQENDAGENHKGSIVGSPFYYKQFSKGGLEGVFSVPMGYYTDTSIDRGFYYGPYSIESVAENEDREKIKKNS